MLHVPHITIPYTLQRNNSIYYIHANKLMLSITTTRRRTLAFKLLLVSKRRPIGIRINVSTAIGVPKRWARLYE